MPILRVEPQAQLMAVNKVDGKRIGNFTNNINLIAWFEGEIFYQICGKGDA